MQPELCTLYSPPPEVQKDDETRVRHSTWICSYKLEKTVTRN